MSKFSYLIRVKSNINLIKSFLQHSFNLHFDKKKRKEIKKKHQDYLSKKKITNDYFSLNAFDWLSVLDEFSKKQFNYLEIGSFEGNSALFVAENFIYSHITCVDAWAQLNKEDGKSEGYEHLSIKKIEDNFDENIKFYQKKILKIKMRSDLFFKENKDKFDVIYIDGSHFADDVYADCKAGWQILKKEGILILDDFFWKGYSKLNENPAYAINKFLSEVPGSYKVIKLSKLQLFLRKIN